jgi:hypothetical protein
MIMFGSTSDFIAGCARSATKINFALTSCVIYHKDQNCPQRCLNSWDTPPVAGRVRVICFSDAELDRSCVTVLGRVNGCCIRLRRRTLFYLLVSASIALPSVDAFSNPAHKQAASHPSKAVKAENHKHRVGTQASHRGKTAKAENHKHQSQTEAKHSERALGPRILLPRDPTSAADSIPATPELAAIKQAIRLVQQHKFSEATALTASINDPVAQKLVEWTYLRDSGAVRSELLQAADMLYAIGEFDLLLSFVSDLAETSSDVATLSALGELTARHNDAQAMLAIGKTALARGLPMERYAFPEIGVPAYSPIGPPH